MADPIISSEAIDVTRAVPAVSRALDVLELFLDKPTLTTPEITERLGLPRTTVHELVSTLVDRSYLVAVDGWPVRFRLGLRLFQLGNQFVEELDLAHEARPVATAVAARCEETVQVAVLDGTHIVYVARVNSTHAVSLRTPVGRRRPAHCTAAGKVLLSGLTAEALDARYPKGKALPGLTARSINSPTRLRAVLAEIRRRGVAYDDGESSPVVRCVAAAVFDHTDTMVAALSIAVPILRWNGQRNRQWTKLVREGASDLSRRLGHRRPL